MNDPDLDGPELQLKRTDVPAGTWRLGGLTLLTGVVALGLAIIPAIVFGVTPTWLDRRPAPEPRVQGQKSIEWRSIKFKWGGKPAPDAPAPTAPMTAAKSFAVATAVVALVGLVLGPVAWQRERQWVLTGPGMGFCFLALTWQYVIFGIAAGVAAAIFLFVLSKLPL